MKFKLLIIIILFPFIVFSQVRGSNSYMFLNLETSPRVAAMGGNVGCFDHLTVDDLSDIGLVKGSAFSIVNS